jgi:nitroreductase
MNYYDLIAQRRSIRRYRPDPIPDEVLGRILEAARIAPSACNIQPWHFYVVRDAELRGRMFSEASRMPWAAVAPAIVVACSIPARAWVRGYDGKSHADIDVAIAMEHLVLAATAEGLGSCWICAFDPRVVRDALALPAELEPVAITPLGYAVEEAAARPRKALEEIVTFR